MGIKIYTYSNPYDINRESFWNEIKDSPHFCVSQTMVNGLEEIYPSLKNNGYLTTIRILINSLYAEWEDENTRVRQIMEIDNSINNLSVGPEHNNIKQSLEYNTKSLVKCVRIFRELGLKPGSFDISRLNESQKYLVEIYKLICQREKTSFEFNRVQDKSEIDKSILSALKNKHKDYLYENVDMSTIVIHGIHQFSPAMLCAIEDIAKHKNVILLFNYQDQYKTVYQTWINIYSLFEKKIVTSSEFEFKPVSLMVDSYPCNYLADSIGSLSDGHFNLTSGVLDQLEIIEFENLTEFAGYCALLYEKAKIANNKRKDKKPVLYDMTEQLYSASGKVNDILRAYFPEQFGERHFLDYPIGHFFVSVVEMWDCENERVKVDELSLVKDCLSSGIISEKRSGQLLNTLNTIEFYISKESTLEGIINSLRKLRKYVSPKDLKLKRIGYLNVTREELDELRQALEELNRIIIEFFKDFGEGEDNFNRFYRRIHDFIVKRSQDMDSLDDEMRDVISKLLARMSKIDLPETGTFTCLKQTMSFYLSQDDSLVHGANWIVRDFEQIDGDILRSIKQKSDHTCYHFCCLSDKDICAPKDDRLPWPLDIEFFNYSYEPLEQNYQIFLKSKIEFNNFKRYAFLYGLEFNRLGCKLSYIKSEDGKENEIYHLIKMLGLKVKKYHNDQYGSFLSRLNYSGEIIPIETQFSEIDKMKYAMCPYRFVMESVVQGQTTFRERFLVIFYIKILLQNRVHTDYQGETLNDNDLRDIILDEYQKFDDQFHISNEYEKSQIISDIYSYLNGLIKKHKRLPSINTTYKEIMDLKDDFLTVNTKKLVAEKEKIDLEVVVSDTKKYKANRTNNCMYCSSKDICLKLNQ